MSEGDSFGNQNQLTIKASASKSSRVDSQPVPTPPRQSTQDTGCGLSISGQSKPAPKSPSNYTAAGARSQPFKAPPSCGLSIVGQNSNAQQSKPRDKPHQQRPQKRQLERMSRKRTSSSATLEIAGTAPQPKQRQHQLEPTRTTNSGGVSISGMAEVAAGKLDMVLPPSHAQQQADGGACVKRLKTSGERKKRSIFGYRMGAMLMDNAAGNRRPAGSPDRSIQTQAVGSAKTAAMDADSSVVLQVKPNQRSVGLTIASTRTAIVVSNGDGSGELRIAKSATGVPGAEHNLGLR